MRKAIHPQKGFQELAIDFPADIRIVGGSAGCGKSTVLMLEPLKYIFDATPGFNGIIFRREGTQISTTGGLWDKCRELYSKLAPQVRPQFSGGTSHFKIRFPTKADLRLAHLHEESTVYAYQGAEICYLAFDELTHFTEEQFFYMLSRNRSTCGVEPYVMASTNPQGEGWVKRLVQWWLYPDDYHVEALRGLPIPERQGRVLYMARTGGHTILDETREGLLSRLSPQEAAVLPVEAIRSITFIAGKLQENQELLRVNPGYLGNLMALPENERIKLMDGRWIDIDDDSSRLYSNAAISDLFSNDFVERTGERYITADIALEGADSFVVAVWDGWVLIDLVIIAKSSGPEVLLEIRKLATRYRVPVRHIAFDSGGVGGFLKGWFRTAFAFVGNSVPLAEQKATKLHGSKSSQERPQYFNLRSQCFFLLREKVENCEIFVPGLEPGVQSRLERELRAIRKMETTTDQKLRVIPKSQIKEVLGFSPDLADVFSMRCVFDILPKIQARTRPIH